MTKRDKLPHCTIGIPCGYVCIPRSHKCHEGLGIDSELIDRITGILKRKSKTRDPLQEFSKAYKNLTHKDSLKDYIKSQISPFLRDPNQINEIVNDLIIKKSSDKAYEDYQSGASYNIAGHIMESYEEAVNSGYHPNLEGLMGYLEKTSGKILSDIDLPKKLDLDHLIPEEKEFYRGKIRTNFLGGTNKNYTPKLLSKIDDFIFSYLDKVIKGSPTEKGLNKVFNSLELDKSDVEGLKGFFAHPIDDLDINNKSGNSIIRFAVLNKLAEKKKNKDLIDELLDSQGKILFGTHKDKKDQLYLLGDLFGGSDGFFGKEPKNDVYATILSPSLQSMVDKYSIITGDQRQILPRYLKGKDPSIRYAAKAQFFTNTNFDSHDETSEYYEKMSEDLKPLFDNMNKWYDNSNIRNRSNQIKIGEKLYNASSEQLEELKKDFQLITSKNKRKEFLKNHELNFNGTVSSYLEDLPNEVFSQEIDRLKEFLGSKNRDLREVENKGIFKAIGKHYIDNITGRAFTGKDDVEGFFRDGFNYLKRFGMLTDEGEEKFNDLLDHIDDPDKFVSKMFDVLTNSGLLGNQAAEFLAPVYHTLSSGNTSYFLGYFGHGAFPFADSILKKDDDLFFVSTKYGEDGGYPASLKSIFKFSNRILHGNICQDILLDDFPMIDPDISNPEEINRLLEEKIEPVWGSFRKENSPFYYQNGRIIRNVDPGMDFDYNLERSKAVFDYKKFSEYYPPDQEDSPKWVRDIHRLKDILSNGFPEENESEVNDLLSYYGLSGSPLHEWHNITIYGSKKGKQDKISKAQAEILVRSKSKSGSGKKLSTDEILKLGEEGVYFNRSGSIKSIFHNKSLVINPTHLFSVIAAKGNFNDFFFTGGSFIPMENHATPDDPMNGIDISGRSTGDFGFVLTNREFAGNPGIQSGNGIQYLIVKEGEIADSKTFLERNLNLPPEQVRNILPKIKRLTDMEFNESAGVGGWLTYPLSEKMDKLANDPDSDMDNKESIRYLLNGAMSGIPKLTPYSREGMIKKQNEKLTDMGKDPNFSDSDLLEQEMASITTRIPVSDIEGFLDNYEGKESFNHPGIFFVSKFKESRVTNGNTVGVPVRFNLTMAEEGKTKGVILDSATEKGSRTGDIAFVKPNLSIQSVNREYWEPSTISNIREKWSAIVPPSAKDKANFLRRKLPDIGSAKDMILGNNTPSEAERIFQIGKLIEKLKFASSSNPTMTSMFYLRKLTERYGGNWTPDTARVLYDLLINSVFFNPGLFKELTKNPLIRDVMNNPQIDLENFLKLIDIAVSEVL